MTTSEVEAIITKLASVQRDRSSLHDSIIALMGLLKASSVGARNELAQKLGYPGALDGSAELNTWLRTQIVKLAETEIPNAGR